MLRDVAVLCRESVVVQKAGQRLNVKALSPTHSPQAQSRRVPVPFASLAILETRPPLVRLHLLVDSPKLYGPSLVQLALSRD